MKCFSYKGTKWTVAAEVWEKLGDLHHFVEPFGGTLSMLLSRPQTQHPLVHETVGDVDCYIVNFWRSVRRDPQAVAYHFMSPVAQVELEARHSWLRSQRSVCENLLADPDWFDAKWAGWWCWGMDLATDSSDWCGPTACFRCYSPAPALTTSRICKRSSTRGKLANKKSNRWIFAGGRNGTNCLKTQIL